jgi:DNA polymerase-1
MIKFKDIVQSSKQTFADIDLKIASKYAVEDAVITLKLYNYFIKFFIENNQNHILELAYKLEFPFVKSLYLMEQNGINIDIDFFQNLKEKLSDLIAEIKHKIYEISGTNFNLNSPKQISEVLFEQLDLKQHLPKKKKLSTNEATLQLLRDKHEIINLILDYREKHKLLSTYIEPFTQFDDKVHSSFWQTGTATGRLSSREPNLQNIPRNRTDINIREGFVVSNKQNKSFISIDYSQIELRFLAHFTEEPFLIEAFTYNLDVHNFVARKVFDIPESNEVSEEQRNMAKTVNYGLIYGMGASKLATTLKIDKQQASEILEKYFEQFEKISQFIQTVSDKIEEQNYIETILKRRRYFSEATSNRDFESNKREGFNAILQGSVADLIKQSMLEIVQKIESDSLNVKLILQIHDELLFEVDDKNIEEYSSLFKNIMEKSLSLKVPLKANIKISKNWSFV